MQALQEVEQFRVGVREAKAKQDLLATLVRGLEPGQHVGEGHASEVSGIHWVPSAAHNGLRLPICYVVSTLVPLVALTLARDTHSLPLLVQALRLGEVHNVNLDALVGKVVRIVVADAKVEPLVVPSRVCVHSHVAVILPLRTFYYVVEVARLKICVEFELFAVEEGRVHASELSWLFFL